MSKSSSGSAAEQVREEAGEEVEPTRHDAEEAEAQSHRLHAVVVYDIIQREGSAELMRGFRALWWSGIAAGIAIGFSVLSEAMFAAYLPDAPWRPLVDNLGYSVGFLIVILSRLQLFTENTLTAVLPVVHRRQSTWFRALLRLWAVVLSANVVGCFLFAAFIASSGVLADPVAEQVTAISRHMMESTPLEMFLKGIVAGWLIAALVWMLPSSEGSEFAVIVLMTYLIALGDFTHVIAGSVEALYLVLIGDIGLGTATFGFFLPTLAGNVMGGTVLFALLSYAQVRHELDRVERR
jgi:formate/nitrite transporter FocA (FNT family)